MIVLSKSKIGTWNRCPFYYKLTYIDGHKLSSQNAAMSRGIEIHQMLDDFYKPENKELNNLITEIQKHPLFSKHKEAIANFVNFNKRIKQHVPIVTEKMVTDDDIKARGIIDRVDEDDKGNVILIDYKSGGMGSLNKFRFELALYSKMFENNFDKKVTHWGIYFVDYDVLKVEVADTEEVSKAIKKVESTRENIEKAILDKKFPKKTGSQCHWCGALAQGFCDGKANNSSKEWEW